ncbi:MAG TPA: glycosyltransferase [Pyrinomonadaceae bacterium]|nr:glycosyltransferase [Pyrinomonadaceae bacterium]
MRILWLKTELLHPVDKGGKIRTYQMLKQLRREHHITYLTLDDGLASIDARERAAEYCHELVTIAHRVREKFSAGFYTELARNLFSSLPYAIKKYESAPMRREIEKRALSGEFDVVICDFLTPVVNLPRNLSCATLLFQHNVEAMIWKRHYEVQRNPAKKVYLYDQWRKMRGFEREASRRFDWVVAVSREDRELMASEYRLENVSDVPTGVDTDYFRPGGMEKAEPHTLVFTGSMDWLPNEDAIRYFTSAIWPFVKRDVADAKLIVVGRNPFPGLVELSKSDPSIMVTGRVEDVRPFMDRAAAYIVPIRIGGGTRLKIYEAMAMEKPIISTTIGAEGLPVENGVELILADTPESFARETVRVLKDESYAQAFGTRAAQRVRESFGWDKVAAEFAAICERALRLRGREVKDVGTEASVEQQIV